MKNTVFKPERKTDGKCVQCHSQTEYMTILFGAWICNEECENKIIDEYLDIIQARIKRYEESLDEDEG